MKHIVSLLPEIMLKNGNLIPLSRGEVIPEAQIRKNLYRIKSGFIKRYSIDNDGSESIQVIYGPGDIFALTPVFKTLQDIDIYHGPDTFYYEAITPAELHGLALLSLDQAVTEQPLLYRDLLEVAGQRLSSNIQHLENISLKTINRRLAHLLVFYAQKFGNSTHEGTVISLPLTHQCIADSLSVARETISRRLTRLEEKGLIIANKNIVVTDIHGLRKEYNRSL